MKRVLANVPIVFLLGIAACGDSQITSSWVVDINDLRNTHMQVPDVVDKKNLANHKCHDVKVYKTIHVEESDSENAYEVIFYRNENDTLKCYKATWGANEDMDKAAYKWENDTLVSIRLYNSATKKEIAFQLFGTENRTGMITDDNCPINELQ